MASGKKKSAMQISLGDLLYAALLKKGLRLPFTADEVAAAERDLAEHGVTLPSSLAEPPDFHSPPRPIKLVADKSLGRPADLEEDMARAAREGGEITEDVEEKMKQDRLAAEFKANNGKR